MSNKKQLQFDWIFQILNCNTIFISLFRGYNLETYLHVTFIHTQTIQILFRAGIEAAARSEETNSLTTTPTVLSIVVWNKSSL